MQAFFALIDRILSQISPNALRMIRLGALAFWAVIAIIVGFLSWRQGSGSAAQIGQDVSYATINEMLAKEKNEKKRSELVVPDIREFDRAAEGELPKDIKPERKPIRARGLADEDDRLIEPEINGNHRDTLPPFLNQDESPDFALFPKRFENPTPSAKQRKGLEPASEVPRNHPESDRGGSAIRERRQKVDLLPVE